MSSQIRSRSNPKPKTSSVARQSEKVKQYVNHQLEKTRRQVKSTDLIYGILSIVAFALGFLLLAALWDAWISPLSGTGRWISLGLLMTGCCLLLVYLIVPLLLKKINPVYAAKMIEEAKPTFKNSLLNYVSLRRKDETVNPAVFDAVSRQAAKDLSTVPSDATVDRSKLIQLGFVLVGLMVFAVGYKMLSPKDPLQTFGRVLAPGPKIAKPAVVKITDVQPGDTKVFFGDTLEVTAIVRGSHQPQDVKIEFSTLDGQLTDQVMPMRPDGDGNRYRADLSIAGGGIQQSLKYRVVARDGASPDFQVSVQPNPTIAVESVVLRPPTYTRLPETSFQGQGNIDALEGTNITINAVANLPIQLAYIELLNEVTGSADSASRLPEKPVYQKVRSFDMQSDGKTATASLTAQLNASRTKQFATHYRVKFVSKDGDRNSQANVYSIRVTPDLAPEIKILNPVENDVSIPENGSLLIDIEANDLDFEISAVKLRIDRQGGRVIDTNLKLNSDDNQQRVRSSYLLKPAELGLRAGNQAIFYASAYDNRTSPQSGLPDPNFSRSENFTLTITEADPSTDQKQPGEQRQPEQSADKKPEDDQQQDQNNSKQKQQGEDQGQTGEKSGTENEQGTGDSADPKSNEPGNKDSQQNDPESSEGNQGSESDAGEEGGQDQKSEGSGSSEGNSEGQSNEGSSDGSAEQSGGSGESSDGSESGDQNQSGSDGNQTGSSSSGQSSNSENQSGSGSNNRSQDQGGQNPGESGGGPLGQQGQGNPSAGNQNDPQQGTGDSASGQRDDSLTDGQRQPLDQNASEAEQFRRLQELLEAQQRQEDQSSNSDPDQNGAKGQRSANDSQTGQPGEQGTQPDSDQSPGNDPNNEADQQDKTGQPDNRNQSTQPGEQGDSGSSDNAESSADQKETEGQQQTGAQSKDGSQNSENSSSDSNAGEGSKAQQSADSKDGSEESSSKDGSSGQDDATRNKQPQGDASQGEQPQGDQSQGDQSQGDQSQGDQSKDPNGQAAAEGQSGATGEPGDQQGEQGDGSSQSGNQSDENSDQKGSGDKPGSGNESDTEQDGSQSAQEPPSDPSQQSKPNSNSTSSDQGDEKSGGSNLPQAQQEQPGNEGQSPGESGEASSGGQGSSGSSSQGSASQSDSQSAAGGQPSDQSGSPSQGSSQQPGEPGQSTASTQGSGSGSGTLPSQPMEQEKANIEHARKATDMVLNRLNDEKYDPDPELLESMGWTEDDMNQFLKRWQDMKRQAEAGDAKAKSRYERALKKLGLRPNQNLRKVGQNQDQIEGLNEDSAVVKPLPHLERDFNATLRDINRADNK